MSQPLNGRIVKIETAIRFPVEKTRQLIDEVRTNPCLWDRANCNYKNNVSRDKAWSKISVLLDIDKDILKWKWANLRTTFGHRCKPVASGSSANTWEYYESLLFLKTTMETSVTESNFTPTKMTRIDLDNGTIDDSDTDFDRPSSTPTPSPGILRLSPSRRKRKSCEIDVVESFLLSKINEQATSTSSSVDDWHFGQAIAETLATFTYAQKIHIKARMMQLIADMYEEFTKAETGQKKNQQTTRVWSNYDLMTSTRSKADNFSELCKKCNISSEIGFIGGGNMAQALIAGFLNADILRQKDLTVADPLENIRRTLSELNIKALSSSSQLVDQLSNGIVILAVKPSSVQEFYKCLDETENSHAPPGLLISICAGITLKNMESALLPRWKNLPIVRVMPNTPALVGCGASAFSAGAFATSDHLAVVRCLLETVGICEQVPESLMDAVTGLSGSGPAFVYTIIDALSDGGVKVGLPRDIATKLAVQTVLGSAEMIKKTGKHPAELKNMVCSPGGTTIAGVHVLEEGKIRSSLMSAVEAATKRSKELGAGK